MGRVKVHYSAVHAAAGSSEGIYFRPFSTQSYAPTAATPLVSPIVASYNPFC
jgi:hypothetical protein